MITIPYRTSAVKHEFLGPQEHRFWVVQVFLSLRQVLVYRFANILMCPVIEWSNGSLFGKTARQ